MALYAQSDVLSACCSILLIPPPASPHSGPQQALSPPGLGTPCMLRLGCFLPALPAAGDFLSSGPQFKCQLVGDLSSEHSIYGTPNTSLFPPGTYNLRLFHLPVCSLVYCLSPSTTVPITKKHYLSAHHWVLGTYSRVQQKQMFAQ